MLPSISRSGCSGWMGRNEAACRLWGRGWMEGMRRPAGTWAGFAEVAGRGA